MLNLGQINFGLGVDTRGLQAATQRVVQFGAQVEAAARAQGNGARAAEAALRRQEQAALKALQTTLRMNEQIRRLPAGQQAGLLNRTSQAFQQLSQQMTMGQRTTIAYQRALESFGARMGTVSRQTATFRAAMTAANQGNNAFGLLMRDLASATILAIGPLSGFGARIAAIAAVANRSGFALAAFIGGIVGASTVLYKLSSSIIETALDVQRIQARLESATGSTELAQEEFKGLQEMADRTGLEFVTLAEQFTKFQAAAQGTALEGDKSREVFENIASAVGKFQLDSASAEGVFRALEQMLSKGTVTAEELRQQLGDRLPGAFKAAADAMGVNTQQLNKMLKAGKVTTEQFLVPFSREIQKRLGGDSTTAVDSLRASLNRLSNSFTNFNIEADKAFGISAAYKAGVEALTGVMNFLARNVVQVTQVIGALAGVLGALFLPRVITGILGMATALRTATIAWIGFGAAIAAGTLGGWLLIALRVVGVLTAATLGMNFFSASVDTAAAAEQQLKEGSTALIAAQEAQGKSVRKTAQDFIDASEMKIAALKLEVEALIKVGEAQKQFIRSFDSSGEKWYNKGLDEWFARFVAGAKQANDSTGGQTAPIISQIDEIQKRVDKLRAIQNRPDVKFTLDEDGKLDRAGRALRDASQEIDRIQQQTAKMAEGPGVFENFEKQFADTKKIQEFKDRLMDAGVAIGTVNEKVAAYTAALAGHQKTQEGTFAAMKAMSDGFRDATVGAFNSVADAIGNAVAKGELSSQTFIDIVDKMVAEIISMILKLAIINPILNSIFQPATPMPAFGGGGTGGLGAGLGNSIMSIFGFAKGGAFSGGVRMMAKGGILNGPTMFGTRSGPAMGGEAGDEAVMPLVRSSSGHLGVRGVGGGSGGGGGGTTINVITPPGSKTEQRQRKGANGDIVDLVISEVNKATAGGKLDRGNNARFGARPKLAPVS